MSTYPKRPPFFAHRVTRLLFKSCAAQDLGSHAVMLIIHIVHTEDAARYQGPVRFWNSQLMETMGFTSPKQLTTARKRAVDFGWLRYERSNHRSVGRYVTTIPERAEKFDDEPIEPIHSDSGTNPESDDPIHSPGGTKSGMNCGTNPGTKSGKPSYPVPAPRKKRPRFVPPSVEEVRDYCRERRNSIDPEHFVDVYTTNGWVQGRGKPIRDWKAAVRTWERNGLSNNGKGGASNAERPATDLAAEARRRKAAKEALR